MVAMVLGIKYMTPYLRKSGDATVVNMSSISAQIGTTGYAAYVATKGAVEGKIPVKIHTPLINLSKAQIISQGLKLGVDYSVTSTCYDPDQNGEACGICDACFLRIKGFKENGLDDPIVYRKES